MITLPRMNPIHLPRKPLHRCIAQATLAVALGAMAIPQAHALSFELDNGVTVDLDSTLTYDSQWRQEKQDDDILAFGGLGFLTDDGNRNFDDGDQTQNRLSFGTDLDLNYGDGGVFLRARGWYDEAYADSDLAKASFQQDGIDYHKSEIELLDAFVYHTFDVGGHDLNLRVGEQVVSWGESLFVLGGISTAQGPLDATKANSPGVELKDIFLPVGQVYGEIDVTDTVSVGAYYQYNWDETRIDAPGSYFNVFDGFGLNSSGDTLDQLGLPVVDDKPDEGQWGFSLRYLAENLNYTEFGFYYLNYNDFTPSLQLLPPLLGPQFTNQYFEDINLLGMSFGTVFGDVNVSGEISYRDGQPVQLNVPGAFYFSKAETAQAQVSATYIIGSSMLADNLTFLGEVGYNRVLSIDADSNTTTLGLNVNDVSGSLDNDRGAATATLRLVADYFNVASGTDLAVTATYRNDFNGVSAVAYTFDEGNEQLALQADLTYLGTHKLGVSYVAFLTDPADIIANRGNLELAHLNADRDYIAAYYKYSF